MLPPINKLISMILGDTWSEARFKVGKLQSDLTQTVSDGAEKIFQKSRETLEVFKEKIRAAPSYKERTVTTIKSTYSDLSNNASKVQSKVTQVCSRIIKTTYSNAKYSANTVLLKVKYVFDRKIKPSCSELTAAAPKVLKKVVSACDTALQDISERLFPTWVPHRKDSDFSWEPTTERVTTNLEIKIASFQASIDNLKFEQFQDLRSVHKIDKGIAELEKMVEEGSDEEVKIKDLKYSFHRKVFLNYHKVQTVFDSAKEWLERTDFDSLSTGQISELIEIIEMFNKSWKIVEDPNGEYQAIYAKLLEIKKNKSSTRTEEPGRVVSLPPGIPNPAYSCYLNATLQMIVGLPEVRQGVMRPCTDPKKEAVRDKLNDFIRIYDVPKPLQNPELLERRATEIRDLICDSGLHFDLNDATREDQHDAVDIARVLLDEVLNFCLSLSEKVCTSSEEDKDLPNDPLLQIPFGAKPLQHLVNEYFEEEEIEGSGDPANGIPNRSAMVYVKELPPVLFLHIKRFGYQLQDGEYKQFKLDSPMLYTGDTVKLQEGVQGQKTGTYELTGFVVHSGNIGRGHYISYIKKDNAWFRCNDECVSPISPEEFDEARENLYLASFRRKEEPSA